MSRKQSSIWRQEVECLTRDVEALRRNDPPFMSERRMACQAALHQAINGLRDAADAYDEFIVESALMAPAKVIKDYLERVFASDDNAMEADGMLADIKGSALDIIRELKAHGYTVTQS